MKKIAIIGKGNIGSAIDSRIKKDFYTLTFSKKTPLEKIGKAEIVIIAVKPQDFGSLSVNLKNYLNDQTIVSVMAGVSIKKISRLLKTSLVVRTMPNLGIGYGESLTAVYSNIKIDEFTKNLFSLWGDTLYLRSEKQFDSFTALCGSGPAYFLKLAQQLESVAIANGYKQKTANQIAKNALRVSMLLAQNKNKNFAEHINSIKSKGGVTKEAFSVLDKKNFNQVLEEALKAAINKSKELSK
jgi:pyrroline-5-carboxylate reductase